MGRSEGIRYLWKFTGAMQKKTPSNAEMDSFVDTAFLTERKYSMLSFLFLFFSLYRFSKAS